MRILYLSLLVLLISCGGRHESRSPDTPEQTPPFGDDITLGYLSHVADTPQIDTAVLALSCQQPAVTEQEFTVTKVKQFELRLPQNGVGCRVSIKALALNGERFVQHRDINYDWSQGSLVELVAQLQAQHRIHVRIEQQLPERLVADKHANRFLFKVIEIFDPDAITRTTEGTPLLSTVRGLAMTTWIPRDLSVLPASAFAGGLGCVIIHICRPSECD